MLTENGFSIGGGEDYDQPRNSLTAILPHPLHGRLVERGLLMVVRNLTYQGIRYTLNWRDQDLAFYQPVAGRAA